VDLTLSPEQLRFRDEVRAFLDTALTPELRLGAARTTGVFAEPEVARPWQAALEARGWLTYQWPESAGGPGWTPTQRWIFEKECAEAGAPVLPGMGLKLLGPVLYTYGTPEQKARFLPPLRSGAHFWAQGFSEPGAGSDLASLRTSAVRAGDDYIVNGQKIWTTQAQHANWLFALVRTDPSVKPQRGISFLLIDMASPGVTVRPILSASGDHELNEVFLDDVRVPVGNRVGAEGEGWGIAKFLLANERGGWFFAPGLLADLRRLRETAALDDALRLRALQLQLEAEALEITELRSALEIEGGAPPPPRTLMTKLVASEIRQGIETLAMDARGLAGLELHSGATVAARYLNARAWSIFGGTSEIQLTIIAKAALSG
jgi:acyl-CoA dehydrogenase